MHVCKSNNTFLIYVRINQNFRCRSIGETENAILQLLLVTLVKGLSRETTIFLFLSKSPCTSCITAIHNDDICYSLHHTFHFKFGLLNAIGLRIPRSVEQVGHLCLFWNFRSSPILSCGLIKKLPKNLNNFKSQHETGLIIHILHIHTLNSDIAMEPKGKTRWKRAKRCEMVAFLIAELKFSVKLTENGVE